MADSGKWKPKSRRRAKGRSTEEGVSDVLRSEERVSARPTVVRVRRGKNEAPLECFTLPSSRSKRKAVDSLSEAMTSVTLSDKRLRTDKKETSKL